MNKTLKIFSKALTVLTLLILFAGCSEEAADGDSGLPSTNPGTSPIDTTPIGEVDTSGFWINIPTAGQFDVLVNSSSGYGDRCFIASDDPSTAKVCFVDIMEQDLFNHDLKIQYNIPPNLCDHVRVWPAWHWNKSIGIGPKKIEIYEDASGADPILDRCDATNRDNGVTECTDNIELNGDNGLLTPTCAYDYRSEGGPNCCFGTYNYSYFEDLDLNGTGETPKTLEKKLSWGGFPGACIQQQFTNGWEKFDEKTGLPTSLIQAVPVDTDDENKGYNDAITIKSNSVDGFSGYSSWSNYYTLGDHTHDAYLPATNARISEAPYFVDPIDDLDGSQFDGSSTEDLNAGLRMGNEAWTVTCEDGAGEVIHFFNIYIREWNTLTAYLAYQTSEGTAFNPDVGGVEGVGCDYAFGGKCNDFKDFDDLLNDPDYGNGSWTTNPAHTNADRIKFFPNF